jgi:tetratricopeptide (TPR) repeat protein
MTFGMTSLLILIPLNMDPDFADIPEDEILSPEFWEEKANELFSSNRYREAIFFYDRAIAVRPDYAKAWYNRGVALERLGRFAEALSACDRTIELSPDKPKVRNNRGATLGNQGMFDEALESFGKSIEIEPEDHESWSNRRGPGQPWQVQRGLSVL